MNDWLESHRTLVLAVVGLLIAAGLGAVLLRARPAPAIVVEPPPPSATPPPTPTPGAIRVYVSGAVAAPDVYELPAGSIVQDAVQAAGGALQSADLNRVNLAGPLEDGSQVHVPEVGEEPTPAPAGQGEAATPTPDWPIDINTADVEELALLPGIGPSLAERIVSYRETYGPFTEAWQIVNVSGIGPSKYEAIQNLIAVE
jgi:competence protein ComEA